MKLSKIALLAATAAFMTAGATVDASASISTGARDAQISAPASTGGRPALARDEAFQQSAPVRVAINPQPLPPREDPD
jgi:hypothetical protein